jgi:hypothetical protein
MLRIGSLAAVAGFVPAMLGTAGGPAAAHPAAKVSAPAFRVAVSLHYGQPQNASGFSVILATGRRTAWTFGGTNPGGPGSPVADQWNGRHISPSALPAGLTGFISDASADSPRDIWAASAYGRYLVHWNGQHWILARRWSHGIITGLTAVSARDVWVFGTTAAGVREDGTWHFDGQSWQRAPGLADGIYRASAISRTSIWALSADGGSNIVLRLEGSKWHQVRTGRALANVQAHDILALSSRDVWIVGNETGRRSSGRLILVHWNGMSWARLPSKMTAWAGRLAPGWHGSVLVTATPESAAAAGLILEASAHGWLSAAKIQSAQGSGVSDVALARGSRTVLISGGVLTRLGGNAAIWDGSFAQLAARPDDDDA